MAGMSHKQELQDAHSTKFLNYGHLGTLTYEDEEKRWETLRIVEPHDATSQHSDSGQYRRTAFPLRHLSSKVSFDGSSTPQHQSRPKANNDDVDCADGSHLGPGMSSHTHGWAENEPGSYKGFEGDDISAAEKHSLNRSTLLAFGSAVSARTTGCSSVLVHVPIAVSVSASNAEAIRLVRMGKETIQDLDCDFGNGSLQVAYISNEEEAYWISTSGPVQQVCFAAANGYPSTWMAARLQCSTTIFHPIVRPRIVPPICGTSQPFSQPPPPSVLDPNPIITIPNSRTGGHPHADVNFHPHEHLKFALIDEHGNWSVWLVGGELQDSPRSRFWATLICFGKLWTWDHEKRLRASLPYHDGWHRISWCVHPESAELFICNRRTAAVYESTGKLIGLSDLRLGHARGNQVILDVRWSALVPGHCFVLTSTRIFWLYFMDRQSRRSVSGDNTPHVLLTWQHFRGRGDGTLQLVLLETGLSMLPRCSQGIQMLISASYDCACIFSGCRLGLGLSIGIDP
jgi:RNA polymerase I-specific transcription-initiation factor